MSGNGTSFSRAVNALRRFSARLKLRPTRVLRCPLNKF
jgi:hypothetical protein